MNQKLLSVAKGETPADLVIRNGKVVNVYSGEIYDGGVAICGDTIAAVGDVEYCIGEGTRVVDAGRQVSDALAFWTGISIRKARHWQSVPLPRRCWHTAPPAS